MICSGCTASFFHSGLPLTAAAHHAPAASLLHYQGPCHICRLLATDYHAATAKHPSVLEKFDVNGPAYKGTLREQSVPGTFILYLYRVWEYDVDPSQVVDVKQIMIFVFPWEGKVSPVSVAVLLGLRIWLTAARWSGNKGARPWRYHRQSTGNGISQALDASMQRGARRMPEAQQQRWATYHSCYWHYI